MTFFWLKANNLRDVWNFSGFLQVPTELTRVDHAFLSTTDGTVFSKKEAQHVTQWQLRPHFGNKVKGL